jgi:hypothetical protein
VPPLPALRFTRRRRGQLGHCVQDIGRARIQTRRKGSRINMNFGPGGNVQMPKDWFGNFLKKERRNAS